MVKRWMLAGLVLAAVVAGCGGAQAPAEAPVQAPPVATAPAPAPAVAVKSVDEAFVLIRRAESFQEVGQRLGERLVMVHTGEKDGAYLISVGERQPDRVRFEQHYEVVKADGTVYLHDAGQRIKQKLISPEIGERPQPRLGAFCSLRSWHA